MGRTVLTLVVQLIKLLNINVPSIQISSRKDDVSLFFIKSEKLMKSMWVPIRVKTESCRIMSHLYPLSSFRKSIPDSPRHKIQDSVRNPMAIQKITAILV